MRLKKQLKPTVPFSMLIEDCLHSKYHHKETDICQTCVNLLRTKSNNFDIRDLPIEFRILYLAILDALDSKNPTECWELRRHLRLKIQNYNLRNLIYAFFKGDIGNSVLKMTCKNPECYNPHHMKSRFEPDQISKKVRVGFSRKYVSLEDLSDKQWLRF